MVTEDSRPFQDIRATFSRQTHQNLRPASCRVQYLTCWTHDWLTPKKNISLTRAIHCRVLVLEVLHTSYDRIANHDIGQAPDGRSRALAPIPPWPLALGALFHLMSVVTKARPAWTHREHNKQWQCHSEKKRRGAIPYLLGYRDGSRNTRILLGDPSR